MLDARVVLHGDRVARPPHAGVQVVDRGAEPVRGRDARTGAVAEFMPADRTIVLAGLAGLAVVAFIRPVRRGGAAEARTADSPATA